MEDVTAEKPEGLGILSAFAQLAATPCKEDKSDGHLRRLSDNYTATYAAARLHDASPSLPNENNNFACEDFG